MNVVLRENFLTLDIAPDNGWERNKWFKFFADNSISVVHRARTIIRAPKFKKPGGKLPKQVRILIGDSFDESIVLTGDIQAEAKRLGFESPRQQVVGLLCLNPDLTNFMLDNDLDQIIIMHEPVNAVLNQPGQPKKHDLRLLGVRLDRENGNMLVIDAYAYDCQFWLEKTGFLYF